MRTHMHEHMKTHFKTKEIWQWVYVNEINFYYHILQHLEAIGLKECCKSF